MNSQLSSHRSHRHRRGITLIECLVYIAAIATVMGMGTAAFYACFNSMKALRRNADDISRTIGAGELWRKDMRAATRPVQFDAAAQLLRIPRGDTQVSYKFSDAAVQRQARTDAPWVTLLPNVQQSEMVSDPRTKLTAWRWELELKSARPGGSTLRPQFSFTAVPGVTAP